MDFLSDEWLAMLDRAARSYPIDGREIHDIRLTIDNVVIDGPTWRFTIDHGDLSVTTDPLGAPDVRLTSDRSTAAAIASGQRAALDAFIAGDLRLGGNVQLLIDHRGALETIGDVFVAVRDATEFTPPDR